MPFGRHSEHSQPGCVISIIIIIMTVMIALPEEGGRQLALNGWESVGQPGCDPDPKFQGGGRRGVWAVPAFAWVSWG